MKQSKCIMAVAGLMAFGTAHAADITNKGTATPPASVAIAQNVSDGTGAGGRELNARAGLHNVTGQSFVATKTAAAGSVSLRLYTSEDFATFDSSTFLLKIFEGDETNGNTTALGSYTYDATVLGSCSAGDWLEFGFDSGITLTAGNTYSFLFRLGDAEASNYRVQFRRAKSDAYAGGTELTAPNTYIIANWDTDPWGDSGVPVEAQANSELIFSVNELITENVPPVADDINKTAIATNAVALTLSGSDANDDPLTFSVQTSPTNGTLTGTEPDLTYTAEPGFTGVDSFTYVANDGTTNSAPATVSITVLAGSGLMGSVGATDPAIANTNLMGTSVAGFSREIIRTDGQTFVVGQTFTLTEGQTLSEIYLQSANAKDFASFAGAVEIKVFSGAGGTATLLHTSVFDALFNDAAGDDTAVGDWIRFTLQDGGVALPAGVNSFLVHWSQKGAGNKWGFNRNKTADSYPGGDQVEFTAQSGDAYPQWDTDPWAAVDAQTDKDLTFYLNTGASTVTPTELYTTWAGANGANPADMLDDTDLDGMSELLEYALGGNPTTNDAATILPVAAADGGWMYYVYNRRDDAVDRGLIYSVLSTTDLVFGPITNATEFVDASAAVNGFESATNRIPTATEGKQFMNLKVELAD